MLRLTSVISKVKKSKLKFLLALTGILLISIPLILTAPKGSLDNRNYAQAGAEANIVPAQTSGDIPLNQPFEIPLHIIKTSTRSYRISGAQVVVSASSRFVFNSGNSHCLSPFTMEYKLVDVSANSISLKCSIPPGQTSVDVPQTTGIPFATVNLTLVNNNPISARIFFNQQKVLEADVPGSVNSLSPVTGGQYDYNVGSLAVPTSAGTPSPVPTFAGAACDLCGWCPPDQITNPIKPNNWPECNACLYNADGTDKKGAYFTVLGCFSTDKSGAPFVQSALGVVFGIAGGIAFLAVLIGAAIVLTSSGNPTRIQTGKDLIFSAIVGLLLILFSVFILRVVGFDILRIPGLG